MNDLRADSPAPGLAGPESSGGGWSLSHWLVLIALIFALHVALLYMFGARKEIVPRAVAGAPALRLADNSDEFLALNDPTLFALPHPGDSTMAIWSQAPIMNRPSFRWTQAPRWLPLSARGLMEVFNRFMQTNSIASLPLRLKPPARLSTPSQPIEPVLAEASTMRVEGDLTQRRLLTPLDLPSWPYPNVIAPSKVQLLVNAAGNVASAVVLPSDNNLEALNRYDAADQRALELVRGARFTPAPRLTIGRIIFTWHTVPPLLTNSPAAPP